MAKIFSWKINGTNKYAYLCHVPNPEDNEGSHIVNGRIDDAAILNRIVRFLESSGKTEIVALYNEMYEEVSGRFGDNNLPSPEDYEANFETKFWTDSASNNVILLSGKDGVNGLDGIGSNGSGGGSGQQGPPGPRGPVGKKGNTGAQGPSGSDGRDGVDGINGENAPYTVDYYFSTGEDVKPNSDGYPTYNGNVATVNRPNNDSLPIWVIDSAHSGICSTIPQLVDPNNYPYRYITQAYHTGSTENGGFDKTYYDGNEFTTPVLDAACPSLSDSTIAEIRESVENKVNGAMTEAIATIEETNQLFDNVQNRLESAESTISEARAAAQAAQVEAQSAVNEARTLATNTRESLDTVQDEISSAIDSFSDVVNDVTIDTQGIKAQFAEFNSDYQSFSGVMTEFAVSASGIFQVSLLATSGLTSAMTMAHEFNSTVDGLVSRLSGCSISGETISKNISDFTTDLNGLHERCTGMTQDVNGLSAKTVEWGLGLQGLSGVMVDVQESKDVISASTMELEASINGLNITLTGTVSGSAIGLESKTAQLQADLDRFNHELTAYDESEDGGTIAYKKSQFEHDINSLKHELTETEDIESGTVAYKKSVLQHDINGLQITAQHLSESATTISGKTMALQASINGISGEFDEASEDVYNFNSRLLQLSATTKGLTTRVAETEKSLNPNEPNSIATRVSELEQTVTGFDFTVIENLSGNVVSNINKITAQGNEITAISATTSGTAAVVNEMRSDYNQFVVSSSEWKKKSNGTFVTKSWNEDDKTTYGYDYIGEPTPIKQYVYYAKDSGVWPQCLYGRYIAGTNVVEKYNKTYVFDNEHVPYDYTAAVSGWFYTNKEETQIFDGNIRRGGPTGEIITNIYTSKHHCLTTDENLEVNINAGYLGYGPGSVFVPENQTGYTEAHWKSSSVTNSNPGLTYGGNVVLTDLLYNIAQDNSVKDYSINYDGTLADVRGFSSTEYDASRWETYYNALTTGTTTVCGGDISVTDFILKYCYSVISEFSGVKQTPSAINMWVKNASTAAQIAAGINQAGSQVTISADHIQLNGNVIASALTAYTGNIGGVNFKDKCITSTNWNGSNNGFKIDMANGIISANTIYLGGGSSSSSSGSGIQLDVEYGEGESKFEFSTNGMLSANSAILNGGIIGGILLYDNNIVGEKFKLNKKGKVFAEGLDVAGNSLIINENEILFSKYTEDASTNSLSVNPVLNINNKEYLSAEQFGRSGKTVSLTSVKSSNSDVQLFNLDKKTTGTTVVTFGGDEIKGWEVLCAATTRGFGLVRLEGDVEFSVTVDTVNTATTKSSYNSTINARSGGGNHYSSGGYYGSYDNYGRSSSSDNTTSSSTANFGQIWLSFGSDSAPYTMLEVFGDNYHRYGTVKVSCSGASWQATSNEGFLTGNATGGNGDSFTINIPQGGFGEGIYYIDVDYCVNDAPTVFRAIVVIYLISDVNSFGGSGAGNCLSETSVYSAKMVKENMDLLDEPLPLVLIKSKEVSPLKSNVINNDEEEYGEKNAVLGAVAAGVTYKITLDNSSIDLLKGTEIDSEVSVSGCSATTTITRTVHISHEYKINKTLDDVPRLLALGMSFNGKVELTPPSGKIIKDSIINFRATLKSGFTLTSIPLYNFTEIFSNGFGYYGNKDNYFLVNSNSDGLQHHVVSEGNAYPYVTINLGEPNKYVSYYPIYFKGPDAGTYIEDELDREQTLFLSSLELNRNVIITTTATGSSNDFHEKGNLNVILPRTDIEFNQLDLRPGDTFNFTMLSTSLAYSNVVQFRIYVPYPNYVIRPKYYIDSSHEVVKWTDSTWITGTLLFKSSFSDNSIISVGSSGGNISQFKLVYLGKLNIKSSNGNTTTIHPVWYLTQNSGFFF